MRSAAARYALAVVSLAAALGVSLLSRRHDDAVALCLAAVVLTTWLGGLAPGVFAALLATTAVDYALGAVLLRDAFPHAVLFLVSAIIVSWARDELAERRQSEEQLAGQYAVARILSQASSVADAAPRLLVAIGRITGWEWAALWTSDREGSVLKCRETWHVPNLAGVDALNATCRAATAKRDQGLAGRVWNDGAIVMTHEMSPAAELAGMKTAVGIPLRVGHETLGALEIMTRAPNPPPFDARQTETLSVLGEQIGQFAHRRRVEQDRESLASLVQNSSEFIGIASLDGDWMFINPAGQQLAGLNGDEDVRSTPMRKLFVEEIIPAVLQHGYWSGEAHLRHAVTGDSVLMLQHVFSITAGRDRPVALAVIGHDITAETRRDEQLRLSQTGRWALKVPSGDRQLFEQFVHPNDRARVMESLDRAIREHTGLDMTYRIVQPDGSIRYAQSVGRPILNAAGEVQEMVGVIMDVTDRKRAARALRRARERALTARFTAILDERTRVAREIHDSLLQGVTGIALQLRAMLPHVTPADTLQRLMELADRTSRDARRAIWDLRSPSIVDDITGAIDDAARRLLSDTSLAFSLTVTGRPRLLPPSVAPVTLRIVEEALTNVVRHAAAKSVWLTVAYERRLVRVTIADDGKGFDVAQSREGHWGLVGMSERAAEIGARLQVRSTAGSSTTGSGTEVVLEVPISRRGG